MIGRLIFLVIPMLIFVISAAATIAWCSSMSSMGGMMMPGGWTMSMMWMRMPDQTWLGAAASFMGMWTVMMVAMMLPSLLPMLGRCRRAIGTSDTTSVGRFVGMSAVAYFMVWAAFGALAFALGSALASLTMQVPALSRAVPIVSGALVVIAGAAQLTDWKFRQLACCRQMPEHGERLRADAATAWQLGWRFGLHCSGCCANLIAILLIVGVMDLRAMVLVTIAITLERVCRPTQRIARTIAAVIIAAGLLLIARAIVVG